MPAGGLAASARMYAVAPAAAAAWHTLLNEVARRAGVALTVVEHAFPATLPDLWSRPDLGCAFMCGWPLALENRARAAAGDPARPVIAAPVPDAAWSAGAPLYRSDLVVAAQAPFRRVEDAFGQRFAFNTLHSHSGANMPRAHLSAWAGAAPLFSALVGPLTTPRRCVEAVADGAAEITAVDSYAMQLLRRHDPGLAAKVRVLASTAPSPVPPLVGSAALADGGRHRLRAALLGLEGDGAGRALLHDLCLLRFTDIGARDYEATLQVEEAGRAAYPTLR